MISEQEAGGQLSFRNWSFAYFKKLDKINACLMKTGLSPDQLFQLLEVNEEMKDVDFREAAFNLVELKKETGKTYQEAEVYIKGLDHQIAAKEKQISVLTAKIGKIKSEAKGLRR